jgi:hypothetical protein
MKINITVDFDRNARLKMARAYADREIAGGYMSDEECLKINKPFNYEQTKDWLLDQVDSAYYFKIGDEYDGLVESYKEHQRLHGEPINEKLIKEFNHG